MHHHPYATTSNLAQKSNAILYALSASAWVALELWSMPKSRCLDTDSDKINANAMHRCSCFAVCGGQSRREQYLADGTSSTRTGNWKTYRFARGRRRRSNSTWDVERVGTRKQGQALRSTHFDLFSLWSIFQADSPEDPASYPAGRGTSISVFAAARGVLGVAEWNGPIGQPVTVHTRPWQNPHQVEWWTR